MLKLTTMIAILAIFSFDVHAQGTPLNYDEALKKLDRFQWIIPDVVIKGKTENYEVASKKYCKDPKDCVLKKELVYYAEKIIYESPGSKEPYGYLVRYRPKEGYQINPQTEAPTRSIIYGSYLITTSFKKEDTYSDFPGDSVETRNYPIIYETKKEKDFTWARLTDLPSKKSVWLKLKVKNMDGWRFGPDEGFITIFGLYPISPKANGEELGDSFVDIGYYCFRGGGQGVVPVTDLKGNKVDYDANQLAILPLKIANGEVEFVAFKDNFNEKVDLAKKIKKDAVRLKISLKSLISKKNGLVSCEPDICDGEQRTWHSQDLLTEKDIANPPNRLESIKSK